MLTSREPSKKLLHSQAAVEDVSIGAKPISPFAIQRSSAMPIALKRPIRKVSLDDLANVANSDSASHHVVSHWRGSSSLSPRSFTVRDAVSDKIPASSIYSMHSEASQSEDSKVRGGQLYESDCNSSSNSLSLQEADDLGRDATSCQAQQSQRQQQQEAPQCVSVGRAAQVATKVDECQTSLQLPFDTMACMTDLNELSLGSESALGQGLSRATSDSMRDDSMHSQSGHKTHGGNFFSPKGIVHFPSCIVLLMSRMVFTWIAINSLCTMQDH